MEPVAKAINKKVPASRIIIAGDDDSWREAELNKNPGAEAAKKAAAAIGARLALPVFQNPDGKETTDFNDLFRLEGAEAVKKQIDGAALDKASVARAEVKKIIDLDPVSQDMERSRISKEYGIRKSSIDALMSIVQDSKIFPRSIVEDIEPAAEPVDGLALADEIRKDLSRRAILPKGAADVATIWIFLSYNHLAFNHCCPIKNSENFITL